MVQLITTLKQIRATVIAALVAVVVLFVLVPAFPPLAKPATGIVVVLTDALAWFLRPRKDTATSAPLVN